MKNGVHPVDSSKVFLARSIMDIKKLCNAYFRNSGTANPF